MSTNPYHPYCFLPTKYCGFHSNLCLATGWLSHLTVASEITIFKMRILMVGIFTNKFNNQKIPRSARPHNVFMCFALILEQIAIISLYIIN